MTWFILTLLSVSALATAELTQQYLLNSKNAFSPRASAVLTFLFQSILAVPVLLLAGLNREIFSIFSVAVFPKILLVSFLGSILMIFYLKSFQVKNISISVIFQSLSMIVATILGIIFFSESLSYLKFIGIGLVLFSIILLNYKSSIIEKNHFYGLGAGVIFGILYTLDKSITFDIHPLIYIFWSFMMIAVWGFVLGRKEVIESLKNKKFNNFKPIIFSGVAYFLYNFFTFTAYTFGGEVGRIDAINNSQIFIIILFEFFILRHTKGVFIKIISTILAVVGIFILATI
jgi:drug/metabolite transporter (DMT)-like permease